MLHSSVFWKNHFELNLTKQRVDWSLRPAISAHEKQNILYSLKAWQLGETSDGSHLMAAANKYAGRINDPVYPEAVKLFITEEQKHGNNLGRYIDLLGETRLKKDWGDTLFRKIRYLNTSMELWTITVIIVESAAQVFYTALHNATACPLLRQICTDILIDEAHHLKFQNERMYILFQQKKFYNKAISIGLYAVLFFATIHAIWLTHGKALKAGGVAKPEFMKQMYYRFFKSMQFLHAPQPQEATALQYPEASVLF